MFYQWISFGILLFFVNSLVSGEECKHYQHLTANTYYAYFTFPNSDRKYENNQSCSWLIFSGGKDLSLEIQWLWVDIEFTVGCNADYVQIYRGMNRETGELLDHRCGKSTSAIQNIGRYGLVYFSSNNETVGSGFKFRYRSKTGMTSCKSPESLTAHPYQWQVFTSPYYPKPYVSNLVCHWVITAADSDNIVHLQFEDFDVELTDDCTKDYLQIHDGGSKDSPLLGTYCGQDLPEVKSTGRKMFISLYSDDQGQNIGFKAKYIASQTGSQCSGITYLVAVRNRKKYLLSPNYPHFYGSNLSCSWLIQSGSIGRSMYLDVVDSDIEYSEGCQKDYVEIYLGLSRDAPIFSRWCGGTRRKFYTYNFYNYLFVHFHTDSAFSGRGFQLSYYLVQTDSVCSESISVTVVRNSWHELTSPYYPTVYEGNVTCTWVIESQHPNDLIEMQVVESEIEESIGCIYDYVTIYDGHNKEAKVLRRWCGKETPHFLSSQSAFVIEFFTDNSYEYKGFKIRLRSVKRRDVCGPAGYFAVKGEIKYLSSPTTLSPLYRSASCMWLIETNPGDILKIEVIFSSLGQSPVCDNTYFKVYDGLTEDDQLLGFTCGNRTPTYISTGQHMLLTLKSSNESNGFFMSYTALTRAHKCENIHQLTSTRKKTYFTTPDFSVSAKSSTSCSWRITASVPGDVIRLQIVFAEILSKPECKDAHVEVFDGFDEFAPSLGKFCGIDEPSFISTSGEMFLRLRGIILGATRFTAVFHSEPPDSGEICPDGVVLVNATTTEQFFNVTPSKSQTASSKLCRWQITGGEANDTILLQFLLANFGQKSSDCMSEYISVHEDSSSSSPVQTFCGNERPTIRSQKNTLHISALSNSSEFSFIAKFQMISDPELNYEALKNATSQKKFFSSPDFFNQSETSMFVHWVIKAAEKEKVIFELAYSGIPRTYNCDMASVSVYNSATESSVDTLLGRFCGPNGVTLISTGNYLLVKYNTKAMSESRGFMAAYYTKKNEPPKVDNTSQKFSAICIVLIVIGVVVVMSWLLWRWRRNMQYRFVRIRHWPDEDND